MLFQWDNGNTSHVISQYPERGNTTDEVESVFKDPFFKILPDRVDSRGEQQYNGVGCSNQNRLLYVSDQPVEKKEIVMLKPADSKPQSPQATTGLIRPKVRIIKNGHTPTELADSGERWAAHQGTYMTLVEVLAAEEAKR